MAAHNSRLKNAVIIIIVFGFLVSSIAGTFMLVMQNDNQQTADQTQEELLQQLQEQQTQQQEDIVREPLEGYEAEAFNAASVTELKVETIKQGDGPAATADSTVGANYFGWTSDGKIFDSTNREGQTTPVDFPLSDVIEGWTKGLAGVKEGSVVKLLIPGSMAYGDTDDGSGRPFGPLAFIVELKEVK